MHSSEILIDTKFEQMGDFTTSEDRTECLETQFSELPLTERLARDLALRVEEGEPEEVEMDGFEQGSDEVGMVGDLCGELPEHLMDLILSKLPVFSFLRLRSVCKRWNTLISDPLFLENCSRAGPTGSDALPLFLLYPDRARQNYPTFDPSLNKWYLLPQTVDDSPPDLPRGQTPKLILLVTQTFTVDKKSCTKRLLVDPGDKLGLVAGLVGYENTGHDQYIRDS